MEKHLLEGKTAITALFSGISAFLGWKGVLAVCWIIAMALDYISGTAAAMKKGAWSSSLAREGLWHKAGMIFAVSVAALADFIMALVLRYIPEQSFGWPGLTLPLVLSWYILTELGSILENAMALGAQIPTVLLKLLSAGKRNLGDHQKHLP